jgi:hypothetical protein
VRTYGQYCPIARGAEIFAERWSGDTEICKTYPGLDEDLYITAEAEAFVKWHAGQLTWAQATREHRIRLDGAPSLVRAFPTWNARSMFAHIAPASRNATSPAG